MGGTERAVRDVCETMKTLMLTLSTKPNEYDNLYQTGMALGAVLKRYDEITKENFDTIGDYDCIIVVDNKDYRVLKDLPLRIRQWFPRAFMGFHQESEVSNIFRRQHCHGDRTTNQENWHIGILKTYEYVNACNFVICHNANDLSPSFYGVFSNGKPCITTRPFLPIEKISWMFKERHEKKKKLLVGANYGWREGGFLGYLVAARFHGFSLVARRRGLINDQDRFAIEKVNHNFHLKEVEILERSQNRQVFAKAISECYAGIYLMEPTACRTNAIAAAVGTPLISNKGSDVAQILFPELCIDKYDLEKGEALMNRLINDEGFYQRCVDYAGENLYKVGIEESGNFLREQIHQLKGGE
jgi:hypothetical protein